MNPPPVPPMTPAEFKPCPCAGCGNVKRRQVNWREFQQHRFNSQTIATLDKAALFCGGCGRQVTRLGQIVHPEQTDYLSLEEIKNLGG